MATVVEWRYLGTSGSPETIRVGGKSVSKGSTIALPADFDFTKEYGSDIREAFRIQRVTPPTPPLLPIKDTLDDWQAEAKKSRKRFLGPPSEQT